MNIQYNALSTDRQRYIEITKELELYTFDILRDSKTQGSHTIRHQSLGADLIASLSSKLLKSVFPFGYRFFTLSVDNPPQDQEKEDELTDILISLEREIGKEANKGILRGFLIGAMEHLLISGNALIDFTSDKPNMYSLDEYVVARRETGDWHTIIIKKEIVVLPDDTSVYKNYLEQLGSYTNEQDYRLEKDYHHDFYIQYRRKENDVVEITEWLEEIEVVEQRRELVFKKLKLYPIRLYEEAGYNYAYGYTYRYLGDLRAYDYQSKALLENVIEGSKLLHLVSPQSNTADNIKEIQEASNGDFIIGHEGDITPYGGADFRNIQFQDQILQTIEKRLSIGFLRGTGVVKQGQQTAYEIQTLINEMMEKFGGFFITISESLQKPTFNFLLSKLKIEKDLKDVNVEFMNGVTQLRDAETFQALQQIAPLELLYQSGAVTQAISTEKVISLYCETIGIDKRDILKDEEEIQAEEQTKVNQQLMANAGAGQPPQQPQQ